MDPVQQCQAPFLGSFLRSQILCLTTGCTEELSGIIFGISETIPEMVPDDCQAPVLGLSGTSFGIVRHQFWDCQAPVLGSSGTGFGISRLFLGYKKDPKRCNDGCVRVFKGVLELPYLNICYISSHSDHVNHPFN